MRTSVPLSTRAPPVCIALYRSPARLAVATDHGLCRARVGFVSLQHERFNAPRQLLTQGQTQSRTHQAHSTPKRRVSTCWSLVCGRNTGGWLCEGGAAVAVSHRPPGCACIASQKSRGDSTCMVPIGLTPQSSLSPVTKTSHSAVSAAERCGTSS